LLPAAQAFPFDATWQWPKEIAGRAMDTYHRWMEVTIPVTMSGCPATSAPIGFNGLGLPMGLQIIAPYRADIRCLQLARAYEDAAAWLRT
jgi:amidase